MNIEPEELPRRTMLARAGLLLALALAMPAYALVSGGPAPDFRLATRGGQPFGLAEHKGQVVMINFWATWCAPCRREMPMLESIYGKYKGRGFTLVGVNVEPDRQATERWLAANLAVSFPIAFDTDGEVSRLYRVSGMPSTVIVDRRGKVRYVHRGYRPGDERIYLGHVRTLVRE